jgi:hypothetical protein
MRKRVVKKVIILYVLKMLEKGSSKERPITNTNMAKVLNSMGIQCDRKTVGRNVDYLIDFGYPIVKLKRGGCYLDKSKDIKYNIAK